MRVYTESMLRLYEDGFRLNISPKHIQVLETGSEDVVVVTYYADGQVKHTNGKIELLRSRCTLVMVQTDAGWKMLHWHFSPIKAGGFPVD